MNGFDRESYRFIEILRMVSYSGVAPHGNQKHWKRTKLSGGGIMLNLEEL